MYNIFDPNKPMRNYNCRIRESFVNGVRQISLDNRWLHIAVLAGKGTDIVEFLYKPLDIDAMFHGWNGIKNPAVNHGTNPTPDGPFFDSYNGGWQELFPSIGVSSPYMGIQLPYHGEVHSLNWEWAIEKDTEEEITVKFWVRTPRSPYLLEKWMTLKADEPALFIRERATNIGQVPLQFLWGHHPALGRPFLDDSCTIELPEGKIRLHPYPGTELDATAEYFWPMGKLTNGEAIDLRRILGPEKKCCMEFGVTELPRGHVEICNHNYKLAFGMDWDAEKLPCLWFWEPDCGCPEYPTFGRDYCLGVEPWTHLPGNLAEIAKQNAGVHIAPGESKELELKAYFREF